MTLTVSRNNDTHATLKNHDNTTHNPAIKTASGLRADLDNIKNSQQDLIGKTITPQLAEKTLNLVSYDGTGTILAFKTEPTPQEIASLHKSVIPALKDTPVRPDESRILTPAECLINIVCLIKNSDLSAECKQTILEHAKTLYLAGDIKESLPKFCKTFLPVHLENNEVLHARTTSIFNNLEKKVYYTKHHDNFFGRLFETTLAEKIVNAPSPEMQQAAKILIDHLIADFEKQGYVQQRKICSAMRSEIKNDFATWYSSIPEVTNFTRHSTPKNFLAMLNTNSPLRNILAMHLTVKYIIAPTGLNEVRGQTFLSYSDIIQPQRYWNDKYISSQRHSDRTGIQLTYQMKAQKYPQDAKGIRPIDQTLQDMIHVTGHDSQAFAYEKPVGVGMSGSANLLDYLFVRLEKQYSKFNKQHARLLAACSLVHSGGHSINESWTVFNNFNFTPVAYDKLLPNDDYVAAAMDYAWGKLVNQAAELKA